MNNRELDNKKEEKYVPRWLQIMVGIVFAAITFLCLPGTTLLIVSPSANAPIFTTVTGIIMALVLFWVLIKCFKLILGRSSEVGLLSPMAIRIVAVIYLLMPLGGIFTGYFKDKPVVASIQALVYVAIFFQLQRFAANRELKQKSLNDSVPED